MPTYPAKFVDLNTVLLFLSKLTFTTRGLSFSVKVHVLLCRSHLREKHNILMTLFEEYAWYDAENSMCSQISAKKTHPTP